MNDYKFSEEQLAAYERDGFLILPGYFARADMDEMLEIARADRALMENANDRLDSTGKISRL